MFFIPVGFKVGSPTLTFAADSAADDSSGSFTVSGISLGAITAGHDNYVVVAIAGPSDFSDNSISDCSIAGIAATLIKRTPATGANGQASIWIVKTDSTTGDIVCNGSAMGELALATYRLVDPSNPFSPYATSSSTVESPTGKITLSLNVPVGGVALACAECRNPSGSATWVGLANAWNINVGDYAGGASTSTGVGSPLVVSVSIPGGTRNYMSGCAASWN